MGYVTFPFPGLCNLIIRQFESWKLTSTGITRVPNHCISSSQTSLSRKAQASPCECQACLFITVLYSLVCSPMGVNHYFSWCNETLLFFFSFFLLPPAADTACFLAVLISHAHGEQVRIYLPYVIKNRYVINQKPSSSSYPWFLVIVLEDMKGFIFLSNVTFSTIFKPIFIFFKCIYFNGRLITLQYYSGFCHTLP